MSENVAALETLAGEIKSAQADLLASARTTLEHAKRIGELLGRAKALTGHGGYGKWVAANCNFTARTAQMYLTVAKNWNELTATNVATVDQALKVLRSTKAPTVQAGAVQGEEQTAGAPEQTATNVQGEGETAGAPALKVVGQTGPGPKIVLPSEGELSGLMKRHGVRGKASNLLALLLELLGNEVCSEAA